LVLPDEDTKKLYVDKHGKTRTMETKKLRRAEPAEEVNDEMSELAETIMSVTQENQVLKDKIAIGQWDASDIEKIDIQDVVGELREQIRVMEIDNKALRESRDMFQSRNAEMLKTIASLKAKIKKLEG
jgi:hypothetical protein